MFLSKSGAKDVTKCERDPIVRRNRQRGNMEPVGSGMRGHYGRDGQEEHKKGLGELGLRRLRAWAFGALCTYREMNQVAGSKAGRCLLLTRRDHVRHPLSFSSSSFPPYILARKSPSPSGFDPKLLLYRSRLEYLGNLSLSLSSLPPFSLSSQLLSSS